MEHSQDGSHCKLMTVNCSGSWLTKQLYHGVEFLVCTTYPPQPSLLLNPEYVSSVPAVRTVTLLSLSNKEVYLVHGSVIVWSFGNLCVEVFRMHLLRLCSSGCEGVVSVEVTTTEQLEIVLTQEKKKQSRFSRVPHGWVLLVVWNMCDKFSFWQVCNVFCVY